MINIFQRAQGFYQLCVRFVFLEICIADRNGDRVYAEAGAGICGVEFDIVDLHPELADGRNEVLQVLAFGQFKMDLKMIGSVLEIFFKIRERRKCDVKCRKNDKRGCIIACSDRQSEHSAGPHSN